MRRQEPHREVTPTVYLSFLLHLTISHLDLEHHFPSLEYFLRNFKALYVSIYNSIDRFSWDIEVTFPCYIAFFILEENLPGVIRIYKGCAERPTGTHWDTVLVSVMV